MEDERPNSAAPLLDRRAALRLLATAVGASAVSALAPEELLALGRTIHSRAAQSAPRVLTQHQHHIVRVAADLIIPETDTPGALAARVHEFVDFMLAEWYTPEERDRFLAGVDDLDRRAMSAFGAAFPHASPTQQRALLAGLDAEVSALRAADAEPDRHFFARLKSLTLYGYYTSEIGQTRELAYVIIPERYDPCAPLEVEHPGGW